MKFKPALPLIAAALAAVFTPPEPLVPSAWATENLVVPDGPNAGERWDPSLTPYTPSIIDVLGPDTPHNIGVVRKSSQTGLTIGGLALVGGYVDLAPCRIGYALPTIDALHEFNREKLMPAIDQTPALARKVRGQVSRSARGSTAHSKRFAGGSLTLINANSAADLRMKTLKVGVADEVDEWADDLADQGDPLDLLKARFIAFHATGDWKLYIVSTPTLKGSSRVDALFLAGDRRYWRMPCPHCGEKIRFEFKHLKFNDKPPYQAHYVCQKNGCIIEHYEKRAMVCAGEFVATNAEGQHPSFHIDALTSLLTTWDHVAEAYLNAKGDFKKEKVFWNTWLGLAYEMKGDAPDHERLMERREDYPENTIPPRGLMLVAGADVQHSGIWVEVVAFAPDRQSWTISARWLEGDTTDPDGGAFKKLAEVYDEQFLDSFGGLRQIEAMAVDAGDGGRANQVYSFSRGRNRAFAIHGRPGWTTPAIGTPTRVDITLKGKKTRRGATLWPIGTWSLKGEWYANLRKPGIAAGKDTDPPGYCHFGSFLDENYFKQVTSEYLTTKKFRGRTRQEWDESGPNHLLDCRVYAMAMADYLGLRRLTDDQWMQIAADRGVPEELRQPDLLAPLSVQFAAHNDAEPTPAPPAAPAAAAKPRRSFAELGKKLD